MTVQPLHTARTTRLVVAWMERELSKEFGTVDRHESPGGVLFIHFCTLHTCRCIFFGVCVCVCVCDLDYFLTSCEIGALVFEVMDMIGVSRYLGNIKWTKRNIDRYEDIIPVCHPKHMVAMEQQVMTALFYFFSSEAKIRFSTKKKAGSNKLSFAT